MLSPWDLNECHAHILLYTKKKTIYVLTKITVYEIYNSKLILIYCEQIVYVELYGIC